MRKQAAWSSAALATLAVLVLSNSADAFHHRYCGCGVYGCGSCSASVCGNYGWGCVARHCAAHRYRKFYGSGFSGFSNCYGGCGWVSLGGRGCGYGSCGSAGCGTGNCISAPSANTSGVTADTNIISDRMVGDDSAPALAQSARFNRPAFRLTGLKQDEASGAPAFERGLTAYRSGSKNDAMEAFSMAAEAEPANALYVYYRALTVYDVSGADAAQDILAQAVEAEKREGVKNWGQRMERVQGRSRVWIEKARRDAGLVR